MWTRATAELPSFHGVSRKKLLACPATQMQSGGGIVDNGNQQTIDGDNQRAQWPTYMRSTGLLWKEPGYKVAWIEKPPTVRKLIFTARFRASRPLIQAML